MWDNACILTANELSLRVQLLTAMFAYIRIDCSLIPPRSSNLIMFYLILIIVTNNFACFQIFETALATCQSCAVGSSLWLCLTCGALGCSRKNFDGTGGNGHAVSHFEATGHPLVCKVFDMWLCLTCGELGCSRIYYWLCYVFMLRMLSVFFNILFRWVRSPRKVQPIFIVIDVTNPVWTPSSPLIWHISVLLSHNKLNPQNLWPNLYARHRV